MCGTVHDFLILQGTALFPSAIPFAFIPQDDLAHESLVVFVCSTTGQGDPPGNMRVCTSYQCSRFFFNAASFSFRCFCGFLFSLQCSYRVFHWRNFVVIVLSRRPQRCFWFSFRDALMSSSLEILISQTEFPFTSGKLYFETHEMLPVICRVTRQTQLCG